MKVCIEWELPRLSLYSDETRQVLESGCVQTHEGMLLSHFDTEKIWEPKKASLQSTMTISENLIS